MANVSETTATVEQHAGGHEAAEPTINGIGAGAIVAASMLVFLLILVWKKVPGTVTKSLDNQIAAIRRELDDAKALRAEAEALRAEYAARIANAEKDAAAMLDHARTESAAIVAKAEADTRETIARREKMASDKIAAAERAAVDELRATAAAAAAAAAGQIIAARHGADADKALVDNAIAGLTH
jgi:F-type H+-transporting ATPase subunit b